MLFRGLFVFKKIGRLIVMKLRTMDFLTYEKRFLIKKLKRRMDKTDNKFDFDWYHWRIPRMYHHAELRLERCLQQFNDWQKQNP
jgi:hypothetical protein